MEDIEEIITFDYIREAYIAEKSENKLSLLPKDFFKKVNYYLNSKEEIYKSTQDEKVKHELKSAKKMVDDILSLRIKKIIDGVFVFLKSGSLPPNMTENEEEIFFKIIDLVKEMKKKLFESDEIKKDVKNVNENINIENRETSNVQKEVNQEEFFKSANDSIVKVRVLVEIPKFIGPDGNWYGPYEKDSVVELSREIANILVDAGFVSINK
ncbi:MAG: hypothetical protein QXS69_00835 [Candidatus Aenigmatarchaeota archaeon]